jgi:RsmE family RNA methyltransferase
VLIGPEGGWSESERARGLVAVGLGTTVLRAETAAVAAGVLLTVARDRQPVAEIKHGQ